MEKRVLFTELDDRGSHLRKEITPTAVVTDNGKFPAGMFWDANKTMNTIVAGATSASDTLEKAENNLNAEIARATQAEQDISDRIDDILGIDAQDIEDLKTMIEDLDSETGILSVIDSKASKEEVDLLKEDIDEEFDNYLRVTIDCEVGDLLLSDGTISKTVPQGLEPIGYCVIPTNVLPDGCARFMAFKFMDTSCPDTGNIGVYSVTLFPQTWTNASSDSTLPLMNRDDKVIVYSNQEELSLSDYGYLPDENEEYADDELHIPSPMQKFSDFSSLALEKNALAYFDGKERTLALLQSNDGQSDWRTAETIDDTAQEGEHFSPAARCVWRFNPGYTNQGDWYIPTIGELAFICKCLEDYVAKAKLYANFSTYGPLGYGKMQTSSIVNVQWGRLEGYLYRLDNGKRQVLKGRMNEDGRRIIPFIKIPRTTEYPTKEYVDNNLALKANASALGTAATKDVPTSGNASATQVVMGNDSRLTDARTPVSHTHTKSEITDFPTNVSSFTNDAGYLTQHQDISGKADSSQVYTKSEIDQMIGTIETQLSNI